MHIQIRSVIDKGLRQMDDGTVRMTLSSPQQTPLGNILELLYYNTSAMYCIDRDQRTGYPHNGGSHDFEFRGPHLEAIAVLELFQDAMENFRLSEEGKQVVSELMFIAQEIRSMRSKWQRAKLAN